MIISQKNVFDNLTKFDKHFSYLPGLERWAPSCHSDNKIASFFDLWYSIFIYRFQVILTLDCPYVVSSGIEAKNRNE